MFWTNVKRVLRAGFISFWRNGVVSAASVFVVVVTLFMIGSAILGSAFLKASLDQIKDKVDINVYFKKDAPTDQILALKTRIEALSEVKSVDYVSRDEAIKQFREKNKDNALIIQSLDELDDNPLGAVFNIKAKEPSQYESIARFLDQQTEKGLSSTGASIIDNVNYYKNKLIIDRLSKLLDSARTIGIAISVILCLMAILVTFNTIRLAIYDSREEINVMTLVGANHSFIRGPFVVEGLMYGIAGGIIAQAALYPTTIWVRQASSNFLGGIDLYAYYISNFWQIFFILLLMGIILGAVSSYIAVRRYLK